MSDDEPTDDEVEDVILRSPDNTWGLVDATPGDGRNRVRVSVASMLEALEFADSMGWDQMFFSVGGEKDLLLVEHEGSHEAGDLTISPIHPDFAEGEDGD